VQQPPRCLVYKYISINNIEALKGPSRVTFAVVESLVLARLCSDLAQDLRPSLPPCKTSILGTNPKMKNAHLRLSTLFAFAEVTLLAVSSLTWAQSQSHPLVVKAVKHAFAPPLSQLAPIPPGQGTSLSDDEERQTVRWPRPLSAGQDAALQTSSNEAALTPLTRLSTTSGLNILGIGVGFPGYSTQAAVPDTNGAAGPTQYVQWVNESFAVFNKSTGSIVYGPANGNTLWQSLGGPCATYNNLDPIVQFDQLANRWVMMMPTFVEPSYLCVAVSTTSDAVNGGWNLYAFLEPTTSRCNCRPMPDYPKWGVWPDGYYVTYDQGGAGGAYVGAAACVVDRNSMLNGNAATMQCFTNTGTSYGAMLPADVDGNTPPPSGSPEYFASFDYNDQSLDLWQFHVNWTTPANSTFTGPTNIPVAAFTEPCGETVTEITYTTGGCIPQSGTSQGLDSYGDRLMYRLAYRNFGSYASLLANHTVNTGSGSQTGIRWYELRNPGTGFSLYQQGTYAPDANYRWMGSIAMDKLGNIALGYTVSSSTMTPSIRYTGRLASDTLGQMEGEVDVLSSASVSHGSQTSSFHWGDYSSMSVDPSDDCTFWYTTEYLPTTGSRWATRIASFSFPACTQTLNYTLSVNEVGQGTVTSSDGQISCTNGSGTCSAVYAGGTPVTLTGTGAGNGWGFSGWSGACTGGNPCNLNVTANTSVTATFSTNWSLVNKASGMGSPLTSLTIPSSGAGNAIIVGLLFNGTTKVTNLTDNVGNTYFSAGAHAIKGNLSSEIWFSLNSTPGATVLTPTFAGSPTHVEMTAWEVAGLGSSPPDAKGISSGLVTSNNTQGALVTTTQTGDFVVSILFASSAKFTGMTSGNSFTSDFTTNGNGWAHLTSNTAASGTYQASWTSNNVGGGYVSSTAAFLQAP